MMLLILSCKVSQQQLCLQDQGDYFNVFPLLEIFSCSQLDVSVMNPSLTYALFLLLSIHTCTATVSLTLFVAYRVERFVVVVVVLVEYKYTVYPWT